MKQLSTGTGLVVLGLSAIGCVILAGGRTDTLALASGSSASPVVGVAPHGSTTTQLPSKVPFISAMTEQASTLRHDLTQSASSTNRTCNSAQWFDHEPLPFNAACGRPVVTPLRTADVNGDGQEESFDGGSFTLIVGGPSWGVPIQVIAASELVIWSKVTATTAGPVSESTSVLSTVTDLNGWAQSLWNELDISNDPDGCTDSWLVGAEILGWADCDADGDLDLVLLLNAEQRVRSPISGNCRETSVVKRIERYQWLRNSGFQKPAAPNPYDFDHDGSVNTADLSLLLMEFTD